MTGTPGVSLAHTFRKGATIHSRHRDVRNHQIETARTRFADRQGFVTAICLQDLIPCAVHDGADIPQYRRFIIYN